MQHAFDLVLGLFGYGLGYSERRSASDAPAPVDRTEHRDSVMTKARPVVGGALRLLWRIVVGTYRLAAPLCREGATWLFRGARYSFEAFQTVLGFRSDMPTLFDRGLVDEPTPVNEEQGESEANDLWGDEPVPTPVERLATLLDTVEDPAGEVRVSGDESTTGELSLTSQPPA